MLGHVFPRRDVRLAGTGVQYGSLHEVFEYGYLSLILSSHNHQKTLTWE